MKPAKKLLSIILTSVFLGTSFISCQSFADGYNSSAKDEIQLTQSFTDRKNIFTIEGTEDCKDITSDNDDLCISLPCTDENGAQSEIIFDFERTDFDVPILSQSTYNFLNQKFGIKYSDFFVKNYAMGSYSYKEPDDKKDADSGTASSSHSKDSNQDDYIQELNYSFDYVNHHYRSPDSEKEEKLPQDASEESSDFFLTDSLITGKKYVSSYEEDSKKYKQTVYWCLGNNSFTGYKIRIYGETGAVDKEDNEKKVNKILNSLTITAPDIKEESKDLPFNAKSIKSYDFMASAYSSMSRLSDKDKIHSNDVFKNSAVLSEEKTFKSSDGSVSLTGTEGWTDLGRTIENPEFEKLSLALEYSNEEAIAFLDVRYFGDTDFNSVSEDEQKAHIKETIISESVKDYEFAESRNIEAAGKKCVLQDVAFALKTKDISSYFNDDNMKKSYEEFQKKQSDNKESHFYIFWIPAENNAGCYEFIIQTYVNNCYSYDLVLNRIINSFKINK